MVLAARTFGSTEEVREGKDGDTVPPSNESEEPNPCLNIAFGEDGSSDLGRDLAIFAPLGSVGLLLVIGLLSDGAYRMGCGGKTNFQHLPPQYLYRQAII